MCRADFQPGKKIQSSVLNQMSEREGGLQWMPDDIVQKSIPLQPLFVDRRARGGWMDKNQRLQLLRLGPKRVKLRRGKIVSIHAPANGETSHAQVLYAVFHLLDGQRRMLQGHAAKSGEALRVRGAEFGHFL